jgi:hypothetical protein
MFGRKDNNTNLLPEVWALPLVRHARVRNAAPKYWEQKEVLPMKAILSLSPKNP